MAGQTIAPGPNFSGIPIPQGTGNAIGEGLSDLGQVIQHHQDASLAASQGASLAQMGDQMQVDLAQLQQQSGDAPDYLDKARALVANYQRRFDSGFGNNGRVRQQFAEASARTFGHADAQQQLWVIDRDAKRQATQADSALDTVTNQVQGDPSDQRVDAAFTQVDALIDGLHLPDADKAKRQYRGQIATAQVDGLMNAGNFAGASAKIESGALDPYVSPEQLEILRNQVRTRQDHAAALNKASVNEQTATIEARVTAGDTPTDEEFHQAQLAAAGIGDTSGVARLTGLRIAAGVNRMTQPWTPDMYRARIDTLNAKGDQRTPAENMELAQLAKIAPGRTADFNRDPGTIAAMAGHPRPALDPNDPASFQKVQQWRAYVGQQWGRMPPLLAPDQAANLKPLAEGTPAQQLRVVNTMAGFGPVDGMQAMRELVPNNPLLARLVTVAPPDRASVMAGVDARKAHPKLADGANASAAIGAFDDRVGTALRLMPQADVHAVTDIARDLYANDAARRGVTEWEDGAGFDGFVDRAVGGGTAGGKAVGGIGTVNGTPVLLPRGVSQASFDTALARFQLPAGHALAPAWRDGSPMSQADFRRFTPVARPDGRYEFHNARDEVVQTKSGGILAVDLAAFIRQRGL